MKFDILNIVDKIKLLGRAQILSESVACDHSGTGIEFCGRFLSPIDLEVDTTIEKDGCDRVYFTVYVDEKRLDNRYFAPIGRSCITIELESYGEHTVRIVKQNETNYNLCEFVSISFEGELFDAPEKKEKYIEYIGDSLSCGMGNLGKKGVPEPQTSIWEDVTQGYTYMSADELSVDYSIVSESGIGLAGSWFDPLFDFYTAYSYKRNKELKYDFERVPDLVMINLGTNDFYLNCDLGICKLEEVEQKVKEFICLVRSSYKKDMPILWISRFMFLGEKYINIIDKAISDLGGEKANIYRLDVTQSSGGAHGHPDLEGHKTACEQVVNYIREKNLI